MIDLYYAPTPNGWKVAIMLEECGLAYKTHLMNLAAGVQFEPDFLAISPNAKMPAIVDHEPKDWDRPGPVSVFESGAILHYLAKKTGRFMPEGRSGETETLEWLFWQAANQGPMGGQIAHFRNYAPDGQDYSLTRYGGEYERNLAVLERRLEGRDYILGDYSVVDMISFPWVLIAKPLGASLDDFPNVAAWRGRIKERPAVRRAVDLHKDAQNRGQHTAQNNSVLFNQTADSLKGAPES